MKPVTHESEIFRGIELSIVERRRMFFNLNMYKILNIFMRNMKYYNPKPF